MTADSQSARDDLAFMRSLVGDSGTNQMRTFGQAYFAAGLLYGAQMFGHAGTWLKIIPSTAATELTIGIGPSLLFIPVISWILYRNRKNTIRGAAGRAVSYAFNAIGLANFFLIAVIGSVAFSQKSILIWLIYPCCVFILQGTAWFFAYSMQRRLWFLFVAAGWGFSAVAMALTITTPGWYILFAGLGLWLCMALPGYALVRRAAQMEA